MSETIHNNRDVGKAYGGHPEHTGGVEWKEIAPPDFEITAADQGRIETNYALPAHEGQQAEPLPSDTPTDEANPYFWMPLNRVRADALHGVRAAREAWRALDPEGAARVLGRIIEPGHERKQIEYNSQKLAGMDCQRADPSQLD